MQLHGLHRMQSLTAMVIKSFVENQATFRRKILPLSSGPKNKKRNKLLQLIRRDFATVFVSCFMLVSRLAYSSTLRLEATNSSENSVDFQRTTQRCMPEECSRPKSNKNNSEYPARHRILTFWFAARYKIH
jgi:hypothetical protein